MFDWVENMPPILSVVAVRQFSKTISFFAVKETFFEFLNLLVVVETCTYENLIFQLLFLHSV